VADTGGGIASEVMARLFEPFVTTKVAEEGNGLGLPICHGLIKGMGGNIEAHNDAEGAVFTITLPRAAAENEDAPERREIAEISSPSAIAFGTL
jgi:C4-dicarboxylate-specific signal transduction histidine kinase